jgi:hypothetical protein
MNKQVLLLFATCICSTVAAPQEKTELYNLVRALIPDSTGYENVGDWAVGNPKKFTVKWKSDRIEMSDDTSINFFRMGSADVTLNGKLLAQKDQPAKWSVMLKGPRMGFTSFSLLSTPASNLQPKQNIDSVFGKKAFRSKLVRACDTKDLTGFYYYELKLPKKDIAYLKITWLMLNGSTALRIDVFDAFSRYAAKLNCPQ